MRRHVLLLVSVALCRALCALAQETCSHGDAAVAVQSGLPPCNPAAANQQQQQQMDAGTVTGSSSHRQLAAVAADNYTFVDDTATMGVGDVGTTSAYTFVLPTLNFTSMFWITNNTDVDETANALFQQAVRRSFLAGVAVTTNLKVTTTANPSIVRLGFANVTRLVPGDWRGAMIQPSSAVVVTVSFYAPNSAASDDLAGLSAAVNATPGAFFAASAFTSKYGQSTGVSGSVGDTLPGASGMSMPVLIALGVIGGAIGALLLGGVLGYAVTFIGQQRKGSKLRPKAMYDEQEGQQWEENGVYEAWQEEGEQYDEDPNEDGGEEYDEYDDGAAAAPVDHSGHDGRHGGRRHGQHQRQHQRQQQQQSYGGASSGGEWLDEDRYRNQRA